MNEQLSEAKFWAKVNRGGPDECWAWNGYRMANGYGRVKRKGRFLLAHRVAWEYANGPIPPGMCVLHHCDNPQCCNTERHLFIGTQYDNNADRHAKGREAKGDRHWTHTHPEWIARGSRSGARLHPERWRPERRCRGERQRMAKLTDANIAEIRARYAAGGVLQAKLAAEFGVHCSAISRAIRGETWSHLPLPAAVPKQF